MQTISKRLECTTKCGDCIHSNGGYCELFSKPKYEVSTEEVLDSKFIDEDELEEMAMGGTMV